MIFKKISGGFKKNKDGKRILMLSGMITKKKKKWNEEILGLTTIIRDLENTRTVDLSEKHLVKN